jgi:hypothetical protein
MFFTFDTRLTDKTISFIFWYTFIPSCFYTKRCNATAEFCQGTTLCSTYRRTLDVWLYSEFCLKLPIVPKFITPICAYLTMFSINGVLRLNSFYMVLLIAINYRLLLIFAVHVTMAKSGILQFFID